jgi:hypothetical protein
MQLAPELEPPILGHKNDWSSPIPCPLNQPFLPQRPETDRRISVRAQTCASYIPQETFFRRVLPVPDEPREDQQKTSAVFSRIKLMLW